MATRGNPVVETGGNLGGNPGAAGNPRPPDPAASASGTRRPSRLLGVRAYARARGISHTAVLKAIQAGRLRRALKPGPRGHQLIDEDLANQEWTEATNPAQQRERHREAEQRELAAAGPGQGNLFGLAENDPRGEPEERLTHARAQAVRTALQAKLLQLELDEKRANLVDRARVGSEVFTVCRTIREAVLTIPDRLAGSLAGKEVDEVREGLAVELRAALVELAQLLAKFAGEEGKAP